MAIRGRDFGTPWHFHPEYELTLTIEGTGHRIVGDNIRSLEPGDLVFVGSGLPHVWQADTGENHPTVNAIVVQFRRDFLGDDLFDAPELHPIRDLLARSSLGLEIRGAERDAIGQLIRDLPASTGPGRVIRLLEILDAIARASALRPVASQGFAPALDRSDEERVNRVRQYINEHLHRPIARADLAELVQLSEGTFSRFFRSRTGKTLPAFVNELRIGRACRRLASDHTTPVVDIAAGCGFPNLSNFNRQFHRLQGCTPRDYRARAARPDS